MLRVAPSALGDGSIKLGGALLDPLA